ncbi:MAG: hypothetical protein LAO21_17995 [Acidobacteriia bacterium]|nr:hypothetical protein [Terriglobia bacterium]
MDGHPRSAWLTFLVVSMPIAFLTLPAPEMNAQTPTNFTTSFSIGKASNLGYINPLVGGYFQGDYRIDDRFLVGGQFKLGWERKYVGDGHATAENSYLRTYFHRNLFAEVGEYSGKYFTSQFDKAFFSPNIAAGIDIKSARLPGHSPLPMLIKVSYLFPDAISPNRTSAFIYEHDALVGRPRNRMRLFLGLELQFVRYNQSAHRNTGASAALKLGLRYQKPHISE